MTRVNSYEKKEGRRGRRVSCILLRGNKCIISLIISSETYPVLIILRKIYQENYAKGRKPDSIRFIVSHENNGVEFRIAPQAQKEIATCVKHITKPEQRSNVHPRA